MKHTNLAKSPSYYELFAVIEAKRSVSGEDEAFEQLLVYTRRFAWGVVVCGSSVRICLLGPNEAMFVLKVMDVATRARQRGLRRVPRQLLIL
ncbi:hypothetical protein EV182_000287 [Spiromyces aspiralis]|uniref:Uncharacterized protein n=1 Tax=Spiromyces aspiralis TaxID=68401 RepID=A0ACC1HVD9_9FUNG|nr:hypothetical protein EV182_000287 [Spiromyces aspiralis]